MPSMILLDPAMRQAPSFDEEKSKAEISQRIGALYDVCKTKISAGMAPNTILKAIPIATDEFHSVRIGEICQEQAERMNEKAKAEGVPIQLEVIQEKNTLYIIDGRYRLKEDAVAPAKAEFDAGLHYFDISHSTLEGHLAALGSANLTEKDYNGLKETLVEAFAMKERGEITDAANVGIVKNSEGNFELSHEGLVEEGERTSSFAQNFDEPPNFTLSKRNVDMITSRVLAEAKVGSLEELMKDEKLLFKSLLKVLTRRRKNPAYVDGIGLTGGVDVQGISNGTILRTSSNQIGKIEVGEVISKGTDYSEFYAEVPGYGTERCRVEKGKDGFVFSVMGFAEDATVEPDPAKRKTRNPEKTFEEAKGDCDEFALLAASYLKGIGFRGKVTLAEVRLTTGFNEDKMKNSQDHAFMIGIGNRQGKDTFYRMDFTLKEKFEEFEVVRKSDGQIDGMASVAANYSPGELMEGHQRVKRAILHEGLDAIEAYLFQVKCQDRYAQLDKQIPHTKISLTIEEKTELNALQDWVAAGLKKNPGSSELYLLRGDISFNWVVGLSNFNDNESQEIQRNALGDYFHAFELDNSNDFALFRFAYELKTRAPETARLNVNQACAIDDNNPEYVKLYDELSGNAK